MEEPNIVSKTESQFSSSMPYLDDSTPLIVEDSTPLIVSPRNSHVSADDSVFTSDSSNKVIQSYILSNLRGSTRSTRGKPPERYGKVYTFDTLVDLGSYFSMPM